MYAQAAMAAIGTGMQLAGTALSASSAGERRQKMKRLANEARSGIDIRGITDYSLTGMGKAFPKASDLGREFNDYYATEYNRLMEMAYPGYAGQRQQYSDTAASYLRGEIPEDVSQAVMRGAAGRSLMGGYGGSQLARNLVARDLGLTSMDIMGRGAGMLAQAPSIFGAPRVYDASQLAGLNPQQTVAVRQDEFNKYLQLRAAAIGMPTGNEVWGSNLQEMGGALAGAGGMGMLSGGMGGMGGGGGGGGGGYIAPSTGMAWASGPSFPTGTSAGYIQSMYGG